MGLKMKSLLILVLVVYGTHGQNDIWDDVTTEPIQYGMTTLAPIVPPTRCTVSGQDGACVESRAYCRTPHTGVDAVSWRSSNPCGSGVCCLLKDVIPINPSNPSPTPPTSPTPSTTSTTLGPRIPGATVTCGIQKRQTVPGFVKTRTNEADPGEYPWAVNLGIMVGVKDGRGQIKYAGTGSLIHDRVVLTAAHVLNKKDLSNLMAVFGDHDQTANLLPKTIIQVSDVVIHSNFHSGNGDYNFALGFLAKSATENMPNVGTVCLPPANYVASAGTSCAFSGWGVDFAGNPQKQLTKTEVPVMTHTACEQRLRQNPKLGPGFQLLPSLTCAGGELGKDLCGGAGGSPLVCPIEGNQDRYIQTGIVSWVTAGCGVDGAPVVFADVAVARPWIDQELAKRQYTTESYTY